MKREGMSILHYGQTLWLEWMLINSKHELTISLTLIHAMLSCFHCGFTLDVIETYGRVSNQTCSEDMMDNKEY